MREKELRNTMHVQSTPQTHLINAPNKKSEGFTHKFQQLNNLFDQSENTKSYDYYDLKDFKKIKIKQQHFSLLHLIISSLSARLSHKNPFATNNELPGDNIEQTLKLQMNHK